MIKLNKNLISQLSEIGNKKQTAVGIVEKKTHSNGLDMAYLQATHHYGVISKRLPVRDPYLQPIEKTKNRVTKNVGRIARNQDTIPTEEELCNIIGKQMLEWSVREAFRTGGFGEWERLSPTTINKKGHGTILVDTGELMQAQSYKVIDK